MSSNQLKFIIGKKVIRMLSLLAALAILSFLLLISSPLDPIRAHLSTQAGSSLSIEQKQQIKEYWGLDKPAWQRLYNWGKNILVGDLGVSMIYNQEVSEILKQRFLTSLAIMTIAWVFSGILGFFLGVLAGYYKGRFIDKAINLYCLILVSSPIFWIALIIMLVFGSILQWFPLGMAVPLGVLSEDVSIWDKLHHLVLPALTLSVLGVANIALHTRAKLVEILESDYILFAKANGKTKFQLITQHSLRNIALPAISLQFLSFSELFGGSVLVEQVFSYPGLGSVIAEAGTKGDMALLLGTVLISALFVFIGNLIADILYLVIDPRIREGEKSYADI